MRFALKIVVLYLFLIAEFLKSGRTKLLLAEDEYTYQQIPEKFVSRTRPPSRPVASSSRKSVIPAVCSVFAAFTPAIPPPKISTVVRSADGAFRNAQDYVKDYIQMISILAYSYLILKNRYPLRIHTDGCALLLVIGVCIIT